MKQQEINELQDPISDLVSHLKSFMHKHSAANVAKNTFKKIKKQRMFGIKESVPTFKEYLERQE